MTVNVIVFSVSWPGQDSVSRRTLMVEMVSIVLVGVVVLWVVAAIIDPPEDE